MHNDSADILGFASGVGGLRRVTGRRSVIAGSGTSSLAPAG